ncbi:Hypothetical predicted protein [Xyrichtys novacula]|uniref:Uncharacterized protein n=1 Tax=Xyrichtys novacula TaxID=13765 RepID=A0AAV1EI86_XYRNO|nr:Hypothetical predicted protein [Xyrichtys novacula]
MESWTEETLVSWTENTSRTRSEDNQELDKEHEKSGSRDCRDPGNKGALHRTMGQ